MSNLKKTSSQFKSIYRISDAQPNWAQEDPSQPDYIKNRDLAQEVRPILVNGQEFLNNEVESGALGFVAGNNITLKTEGNNLVISSTGGAGNNVYLEGTGISIKPNEKGEYVISLSQEAVSGEYIETISITKLTVNEGETLVLDGGKASE